MNKVKIDEVMPKLKFDDRGLIPAVVQEFHTGKVLMVAYMNKEALEQTLVKGETYFFSRSRQQLWHKGETSGNTQAVKEIFYDCDADTLLVQVMPNGPACHTGAKSCFYNNISGEEKAAGNILEELATVISQRRQEMPQGSYTTYLFDKGLDKILKKVGEEAAEVIIAAKNNDGNELVYEAADLIYHLMVLLEQKSISGEQILAELSKRR